VENARKYLPVIIGGIMALVVFFVSRKMGKSQEATTERNAILEKAREAKLTKSILKNSENENTSSNNAE
jgi:hypothetical protein